jgi:hypothetical protein
MLRDQTVRACLQSGRPWLTLRVCVPNWVVARGDLSDARWERLRRFLPAERPRTGRPNEDHRRILNGILWVHRTGAPWRDLPAR